MKNQFVLIITIFSVCAGCVTTTTTRTLVDPETGERIEITEERKDLTETGSAVINVAKQAAYDYVGFSADAKKQEAEFKRSAINDLVGFQQAQMERKQAQAEQAWQRFVELGGPEKLDDAFVTLLERIRAGEVDPVSALGTP